MLVRSRADIDFIRGGRARTMESEPDLSVDLGRDRIMSWASEVDLALCWPRGS